MLVQVTTRAPIAAAMSCRDVADNARSLIAMLAGEHDPHGIVMASNKLLLSALEARDRTVLVELARGASWESVAEALHLPVPEVRRRYESVLDEWRLADLDPESGVHKVVSDLDAELIDRWMARHAEPWDGHAPPLAGLPA